MVAGAQGNGKEKGRRAERWKSLFNENYSFNTIMKKAIKFIWHEQVHEKKLSLRRCLTFHGKYSPENEKSFQSVAVFLFFPLSFQKKENSL
jgi:hypothetical protein